MKSIPLENATLFALVDDADFKRAAEYRWYLDLGSDGGKRVRNENRIYAGRFIMSAGRLERVRIKNGDALDCRKENLLVGNYSETSMTGKPKSKTGFKGIYFDKVRDKWIARHIQKVDGKTKAFYFGGYDTPEEAARAYDSGVKEMMGEFATLNFPGED